MATKKEMTAQIRIRIKAYDHRVIDQAAKRIDIGKLTPKLVDALMNLNLPAGVDIEVQSQT